MLINHPTYQRLKRYFSLREKARSDLFWLAGILGYDLVYKYHQPFHQQANQAIDENQYVFIEISRGFFKTTIFTITKNIQRILQDVNIRILLVSWTGPIAKDMLAELSAHFTANDNLRYLFPEICPTNQNKPETQQWTVEGICVKRPVAWKECTIEALGADQNVTSKHFNIIDVDDIVVWQNTRTVDQINKTKSFIAKLSPLLLQHSDDIKIYFLGTSWEPDDPYQDIKSGKIKAPDGYKFFYHCTPAERTITVESPVIVENDGSNSSTRPPTLDTIRIATFEKFWPLQKLDGLKASNPREYSAFYLLDPEDIENSLWFRHMMQLYDELPAGLTLSIWGGVDPSISEKDNKALSDTAVVIIGIDQNNEIWFLDYKISRGSALIVEHFFELAEKWKTRSFPQGNSYYFRCFSVETIAFQKLIFKDLQLEMKKTGKWIPVREDNPYTDKIARIMIFDGPMRNKKVHVHTSMVELHSQIIRFGKPNTKVDILDAGAQAYKTSQISLTADEEEVRRKKRRSAFGSNQYSGRYIRGAFP